MCLTVRRFDDCARSLSRLLVLIPGNPKGPTACCARAAVGLQRGCTDYVAAELDGLVRSGELGRLAAEHGPALAAGLAALLTVKLQVIFRLDKSECRVSSSQNTKAQ